VLERRNLRKRVLLTMTRRTVGAVGAAVDIFVATRAILIQSHESFLALVEHLGPRERMAFLAGKIFVLSGQMKPEARMIEPCRARDIRQGESARVDQIETTTVMFRVTPGAVLPLSGRQGAVEAHSFQKLLPNVLVARNAGGRHRLPLGTVTCVTMIRPNEVRFLCVRCGDLTGRRLGQVQVEETQDQQQRQGADP
jgi:hypothetical protein